MILDNPKYQGLKAIGYWKSKYEPDLPDVHQYLSPIPLPGYVKTAVVAYLQESNPQVQVFERWRGWSSCRVCGQVNGSVCLTDGTYVWPEGLAHYVEAHDLDLHEEFLDHISRQRIAAIKDDDEDCQ